MTKWSEQRLDELGTVARGRSRHRPRNDPSLYGSAMPFFQTGDVKAAVLHMESPQQWYSDAGVAQSRIWDPGITCITIAANIADTAVLGVRGCFPDSVLGFKPNSQSEDAYFVKYLLDAHRDRLGSAARGTTQDNLSLEKLLSFRFPIPPAADRLVIASTLRSFDELIENNRRRVEVLEEMARAIYREWFLKFRYPGHGHVPLVDSGLGPIPEGWDGATIGDALELKYGKALKAAARRGGSVAVVSSAGVVGWHDEALIDGPAIVVGRKGNVGSVHWVDGPCWPIDTAYFVETDLPLRFVAEQLLRTEFTNSHAAVPGLSREGAYARPFVIPPPGLLQAFQETVDPLGKQASALSQQNVNLADLRDLLLPKLVTGQLDVSKLDLEPLVSRLGAGAPRTSAGGASEGVGVA